jgi:hypothetical protein
MTQWSLVKWQHVQGVLVKSRKDFIQGVHYYLENGKVVFTELYHKERGSCCGNNCRHCPYDPKNKKGERKLKQN